MICYKNSSVIMPPSLYATKLFAYQLSKLLSATTPLSLHATPCFSLSATKLLSLSTITKIHSAKKTYSLSATKPYSWAT